MSLRQPSVVFPDVVDYAIDYLTTALAARPVGETFADNVTVRDRAPETLPTRLVTVRDDGGPRAAVTKDVALGVNVWAESEPVCSDLARLVVALLEDANGFPFVGHVSTSGPYLVPEQGTQIHRYAVVTLTVVGTSL